MSSTAISKLVLHKLTIPFKVKFSHATAERTETSSLWVEAISANGIIGYGESCPRPYVTEETLASAHVFFTRYRDELCYEIVCLTSLCKWMGEHSKEIDSNPAAWCAIELAILDMLAKQEGETIEAFLSLPPLQGCFQYSAVLGDAEAESFKASTEQYNNLGFTDFKLKLSGNFKRDQEKIAVMRECATTKLRVRVDANNLWETADESIAFLSALDYPFFAIEEPLQPNAYSGLELIAEALKCKIILDESFLRVNQFAMLKHAPKNWLINLRVSKMGGLLRSLAIIEGARALDFGLIIGAQVGETSLLTRAGLAVAQAARNILVAQEGAFGTHLLERDICDPSLMFGKRGLLDSSKYPSLNDSGLGIRLCNMPDFISKLL